MTLIDQTKTVGNETGAQVSVSDNLIESLPKVDFSCNDVWQSMGTEKSMQDD